MDLQELTTDLYRLRLPTDRAYLLNSYLLLGPDGVTIVDTGWPGSAPLVASALARLGRRRADVERIVLTHFHDDHVGSAAEIASWSPSTVVAGRDDAPFIRGTAPGPWPELTPAEQALNPPLPGTVSPPPPCRVHLEVDDGDVFDLPGGAVVVHVPGHTPGSIALHLPQQGRAAHGRCPGRRQRRGNRRRLQHQPKPAPRLDQQAGTVRGTDRGLRSWRSDLSEASERIAARTDPLG